MKSYAHDMGYKTQNGVRMDGGAGSGNWGHVGRPGERGGSGSGGGVAFRGESTTTWMKTQIGKYCSQAKIRDNTMKKLKSTSARVRAEGVKQAQMFNMEQKSYKNVTNFDPNASKNILANAKKSVISEKYGVKGTKAMRDYEIQNHNMTAQQAANLAGGKTPATTLKSIKTQNAKATAAANQATSQTASNTNQKNATKTTASKTTASATAMSNNNPNTTASTTAAKPQAQAPKTTSASKGTTTNKTKASSSNSSNSSSSSSTASTTPTKPQAQASTTTTTGRPLDNPNYQKALSCIGDKVSQKAFYQEAKTKGKYHTDSQKRGSKYNDTQSKDNGNIQKMINYMGLTGKPTLVDSATFNKMVKGNEKQIIFRGCSKDSEKQFKDGNCNRMGGIAYGTGIYFGGSNDGKQTCAYGKNIEAFPKPDAKILEVDGSGVDKNGHHWRSRDSRGNNQFTEAIISGYDAVRIKRSGFSAKNGSDYILVWNRSAFIVKK